MTCPAAPAPDHGPRPVAGSGVGVPAVPAGEVGAWDDTTLACVARSA